MSAPYQQLTVIDLIWLYGHFVNKKKTIALDKERAAKIDKHLGALVDGLQAWDWKPRNDI
jgi:hypothetical protein